MLLHVALVDFFYIFFWFAIIVFLISCSDLLVVIIYSELIWVVIYSYMAINGIINDDPIIIITLLFMALAGLEFCTGFVLSIFFKNFKKSFVISNDFKIEKSTNVNFSI